MHSLRLPSIFEEGEEGEAQEGDGVFGQNAQTNNASPSNGENRGRYNSNSLLPRILEEEASGGNGSDDELNQNQNGIFGSTMQNGDLNRMDSVFSEDQPGGGSQLGDLDADMGSAENRVFPEL